MELKTLGIAKEFSRTVHVVGGGLAGTEAAWQLARMQIPVKLYEMRPSRKTAAHQTGNLAELVCSNSFRSDDKDFNAVGILHEELRRCKSLIMHCADQSRVPAGSALAVDRECFSKSVELALENEPNIIVIRKEIVDLPSFEEDSVIIATGPLTSQTLSNKIREVTGTEHLSFFDAIAPIIYTDSINFDKAWRQSRYDKGDGADYINCPMNADEYYKFVEALLTSAKFEPKHGEEKTPYFEGCLPLEVMAERGRETLTYGPLKPVGLDNPHNTSEQLKAVVQLRQDNIYGTLYNMVGFQTRLKHGDQVHVFRSIPGLENAEFARLGGIHRNTFINSPKLLDKTLALKGHKNIRFAGQITGCEGYVESAAVGLLAGKFTGFEKLGRHFQGPSPETALGSLLKYITDPFHSHNFQPMNINFGLFSPLNTKQQNASNKKLNKKLRKMALAKRALSEIEDWIKLENAKQ